MQNHARINFKMAYKIACFPKRPSDTKTTPRCPKRLRRSPQGIPGRPKTFPKRSKTPPFPSPRRPKNLPKTLPRRFQRRHQDSPRATRPSKIKIWSIFGTETPWGTDFQPWYSRFVGPFSYTCWCQICVQDLWQALCYYTYNFKKELQEHAKKLWSIAKYS